MVAFIALPVAPTQWASHPCRLSSVNVSKNTRMSNDHLSKSRHPMPVIISRARVEEKRSDGSPAAGL